MSKQIAFWILYFVMGFSYMPSVFANETGTLVVVNKNADTVSFIDLKRKKIVATRKTEKGPHEVAISKNGKWAVVTNYAGGNSLTVFDVPSASVVRTINLSRYSRPHGILFLADQERVVVSSEGSDSVVVVNVATGKIDSVIGTGQKGSHMVALPSSSKYVYTTNMGSDTVSEMEIETGKLLRKLPTEEVPEAITVNAKGTELWVGSNKEGLLTVYDVKTNEKIAQWSDYSFPYRILLNDNQQFAVIPDFRNDTLDVVNVVNKKRLKRITFDARTTPNGVIFSPDQKVLFMSGYGADKVFAIAIPSGEVLYHLPTGDGPDGIGYSALQVEL